MHLEYFKNEILPLKDKLYRYALSFLKEKAESEDVVQEVFLRLWQKRKQLNEIKNIEAWSMTITRNLTMDRLKAQKLRFNKLQTAQDLVQENLDPEDLTVRSEEI